jgi:hypothetical protein
VSTPPSAPEAAPTAAHHANQSAPEPTGQSASGCGVDELVEFHRAVIMLDSNDRIANLDQVLLLKRKELRPHLLGLRLGGINNGH